LYLSKKTNQAAILALTVTILVLIAPSVLKLRNIGSGMMILSLALWIPIFKKLDEKHQALQELEELRQERQLTEAICLLKKLIRNDPGDGEYYSLRAAAYKDLGEAGLAAQDEEIAMRLGFVPIEFGAQQL
jgi:tetratricopeptide (TPR) repeat protein